MKEEWNGRRGGDEGVVGKDGEKRSEDRKRKDELQG